MSSASAPTSFVCSECHGMFPSATAFSTHLLWHNKLRGSQPTANTAPPPSAVPTPSIADRANFGSPTRPASHVDGDVMTPGVIAAFAVESGFGTIVKLDGSPSPNVNFYIDVCDVRRPPPTPCERVMIRETAGPHGSTIAVVRRPSSGVHATPMPAALQTFKPNPTPVMRATTQATPQPPTPPSHQVSNAQPSAFTPEQYQAMIVSLSSPRGGAMFVSAGIGMLARTQPVKARTIETLGDRETETMLLIVELQNELDQVQRRALLSGAGGFP